MAESSQRQITHKTIPVRFSIAKREPEEIGISLNC